MIETVTVIAVVQAWLAYIAYKINRQISVGLSPVLMIVSSVRLPGTLAEHGESDTDTLLVDFEIWNRRKHPILVRAIELDLGPIDDTFVPHEKEDWYEYPDLLCLSACAFRYKKAPCTIAANESLRLECILIKGKASGPEPTCTVGVEYTEPVEVGWRRIESWWRRKLDGKRGWSRTLRDVWNPQPNRAARTVSPVAAKEKTASAA